MSRGVGIFTQFGVRRPAAAPAPIQDDIDIRAVGVAYGNPSPSFGNDWDLSFPVTTSAELRVVGFRFQVNIPKDATILSAVLSPYQNQNSTWTTDDNRTLGAEQVDDASMPTNWSQIESRYTNRGTTVTWSNSGTILNNNPVPTGDISAMIQAIVNRSGWAANQHMMLWCSHPGNGGHNAQWRSVVSQSAGVQPRLEVEFEYLP